MSSGRKKTAVLISGSGTTLQSLINAGQEDASFPAEISLVISNKPDVMGLERAKSAGIPTKVIPHKTFNNRDEFDAALHTALVEDDIEFVCLAGFMRILTEGFLEKWLGRMLNIHPSLLPAFKGNRAQEQVLASDVPITGATVHAVIPELDAGPIIAQGAVPREQNDTLETLSARVRQAEQLLYPLAVRTFLGQCPVLPVTNGMLFSNNPEMTFVSMTAGKRV